MKVLYFLFAVIGMILTGLYLAFAIAACAVFCVFMLIAAIIADAWSNAGARS